jgi:hypothetical protein
VPILEVFQSPSQRPLDTHEADVVHLSYENPKTFHHYLYFLNTRHIIPPAHSLEAVELYNLAEFLQDDAVKEGILDKVRIYVFGRMRGSTWSATQYPSVEYLETLYDGTPPSNSLRRFLVQVWAYCVDNEMKRRYDLFPTNARKFPEEFIEEVRSEDSDVVLLYSVPVPQG